MTDTRVSSTLDTPVSELLDLPPIETAIPGAAPVTLRAYYPHFRSYYPACEPQTKRWCVRNIRPHWRIFDVGANIGYFSVMFGRLAPAGAVAAYEPTDTIAMLEANLALEGIGTVTPLKIALGAEAGTISAPIYRIWGEEAEARPYAFSTVDEEVRRLGWDRLDLLKIDVDSFDLEVLKGAVETMDRHAPWVLVELNHALARRGQSVPEALDWLAAQGFSEAFVLDRENFLLRKTGHPVPRAGMALRFDREPVYLPPRRTIPGTTPAARADGPFAVLDHGRAEADGTITLHGAPWSYGAMIPVEPETEGAAVLKLPLEVRGGDVGVLCVAAGLAEVIGREAFVAGGTATEIEIEIPQVERVVAVILRKGPASATPAQVRTGALSILAAHEDPDAPVPLTFDPARRNVTGAEIARGLPGAAPADVTRPADEIVLDIVEAQDLGARLGSDAALAPPRLVMDVALGQLRMEEHDARILAQIYRTLRPARHFEFGTWEGFGARLCAQSCDAHIWTVNLPEGEVDAEGRPLYADASGATDAGDRLGRLYRASGHADRVTQLLMDSRELSPAELGEASFDTVLIDGGHAQDVVAADTDTALALARPGGLVMWHDFCPDPELLPHHSAAQGVAAAVLSNWRRWRPMLSDAFWVRPSWLLIGVRSGTGETP